MSTFVITTAIDYPNGAPHIGHLYEKLVSDTYARWQVYLSESCVLNVHTKAKQVFFLTGTDENGQKLQKSAAEQGWDSVQNYVDHHVAQFRRLCAKAELTHTDFIRTTDARHQQTVREMWMRLVESGHIYRGEYSGLYCYSCEQFYPASQVLKQAGESGQTVPHCPVHQIPLAVLAEPGYFFKLSKYTSALKAYFRAHQDFIFPPAAYDEILSRLHHEDLHDLPVSRLNKGWGIEVPSDGEYVIYTWFDALLNYYTPVFKAQLPAAAWPVDMHVIGKDINWFHSVIWSAMLMALGLELPKRIMVHGMILDGEGKKMSKSMGNIICPMALMDEFALDTLRFVFLKTIPSGKDGKISYELIRKVHNGQLANDLGNLVSRLIKLTLKMGHRRLEAQVSAEPSPAVLLRWQQVRQMMVDKMAICCHHDAMATLWAEVMRMNSELNLKKPWSMDATSIELKAHLTTWLLDLYCLACLLQAFLPDASHQIKVYLGVTDPPSSLTDLQFTLHDPEPLFVKK